MAAHTLFNDTHTEFVAHVCNYLSQPRTYKADSFLSVAEPVECIPGTGKEPQNLSEVNNNTVGMSVQLGKSSEPASCDLRLSPVQNAMTGLRTLTICTTLAAEVVGGGLPETGPSSSFGPANTHSSCPGRSIYFFPRSHDMHQYMAEGNWSWL